MKVTKWAHYSLDEEQREGKREVRKIMRMKKTKTAADRKEKQQEGKTLGEQSWH